MAGRDPIDATLDTADLSATTLSQALIAAYRGAQYAVEAPPAFVLRVGRPSSDLDARQRRHGVRCSAFLTAANPASRAAAAAVNAAAHRRLLERLAIEGWTTLPGRGIDPGGNWPDEASLLALGLPQTRAIELAREFGQAALLVAGEDAVPRLLLLA
ncbi:MAG: DUF3293 domain-containing protein [Proteobacteria bacterium]|nr:DUF3293 domain-containing protein [Pseudomonadota bacterium]